MENLSFKKFIERSGLKIDTAIELGGGSGEDASLLSELGTKRVVTIDKKCSSEKGMNNQINFVEADYFDIEKIKENIGDTDYDLVFSCYSLCFNTQQKIEEDLPFYLEKIKERGIFYILDFTSEEKVVTKRTNLFDGWFLSLLNKYFHCFELRTQEVFEDSHKHTHNVFELICFKKI